MSYLLYATNVFCYCFGRNGLTNEELLHVLSLDDEVLDEIYQYWPPPDPKEVAVPTLVWARLRYELEEYLVERQAEGKTVLVLYHRWVLCLLQKILPSLLVVIASITFAIF